jgi:hypothetical protein
MWTYEGSSNTMLGVLRTLNFFGSNFAEFLHRKRHFALS